MIIKVTAYSFATACILRTKAFISDLSKLQGKFSVFFQYFVTLICPQKAKLNSDFFGIFFCEFP